MYVYIKKVVFYRTCCCQYFPFLNCPFSTLFFVHLCISYISFLFLFQSHHPLIYSILSYLSYPILSYPILSYPILSYPILSYPIYSILSILSYLS